MISEYIDKVEKAIEKATRDAGDHKLVDSIFALPGMSTRENRILLNELVTGVDKYLEIGIHQGSTFVSAMYNNSALGVAIDNFSQFGGQEVKYAFDDNCRNHKIENFVFLNRDCFELTPGEKELIRGTNVYFYDGDHREIDQQFALTRYIDLMADTFIYIVDDWNHIPARVGTKTGLELTKAVVHKEWVLDMTTTSKGWHNGLYIAVLSKA